MSRLYADVLNNMPATYTGREIQIRFLYVTITGTLNKMIVFFFAEEVCVNPKPGTTNPVYVYKVRAQSIA